MDTIKLIQLTLKNFKGIQNFTLKADGEDISVHGDNGTGKTSLFDAFWWNPFGKDSKGRTQFDIKTLDKNNNAIPRLEHEVETIWDFNGRTIVAKRVYKENWTRKRGAAEKVFDGHTTDYYWNDVPLSQSDYQAKVSSLVDESVFKMITSPTAFNDLAWQDRRKVLIDIAGDIEDTEVAKTSKEFSEMMNELEGKSLEEYKKQLASQRKKIRDQIKDIPSRIDEVYRAMPTAPDYEDLNSKKSELVKKLNSVDGQISDASKKYEELSKKREQLSKSKYELTGKIDSIKSRLRSEIDAEVAEKLSGTNSLNASISNLETSISKLNNQIALLEDQKTSLEESIKKDSDQLDSLGAQWDSINAETFAFDENSCTCPTCKQELPQNDINTKREVMQTNFNKDKRRRLDELNMKGQRITAHKKGLETQLSEAHKQSDDAKSRLSDLDKNMLELKAKLDGAKNIPAAELDKEQLLINALNANTEYNDLAVRVKQLDDDYNNLVPADDSGLKAEKAQILSDINQIDTQLNVKVQIERSEARKKELMDQEDLLNEELLNIEKNQFTVENFEKAKCEMLESKINKHFKYARFKLFETQINGAQVPACVTLVDGVPFESANNAARINYGLDIISTLSKHYGVSAPVMIDNAEAVVKLIDIDTQIIRLVVDESAKELEVKREKELADAV